MHAPQIGEMMFHLDYQMVTVKAINCITLLKSIYSRCLGTSGFFYGIFATLINSAHLKSINNCPIKGDYLYGEVARYR